MTNKVHLVKLFEYANGDRKCYVIACTSLNEALALATESYVAITGKSPTIEKDGVIVCRLDNLTITYLIGDE